MANTLTLSASALYRYGTDTTLLRLLEIPSLSRTITSNLISGGIQNIGTSAEAIDVGEMTSEGWAVFVNKDATNYIEIGWDATGFQSAFKLLPGDFAIVPLNPSRTWQAQANTAACNLYYQICGTP